MILYKCFMDGEQTGTKVSPEEAKYVIRGKLKPEEYVTSQQILESFF